MEKESKSSNSAEKLAKENKVLQEDNEKVEDSKKTDKKSKLFKSNKDKIKELEEQNTELKTEVLRARADFENYRKRMQKELTESRQKAINSFVIDILPSIDNFEMSLKMTDNKEMFIKGVEMIHGNLLNTLKENHYEQFCPKIGDEFNPHIHEPVLIESEEHEPGKVINVLQIGYKVKDTVVRPARVQIAKEKEEEVEEDVKE